MVKWIGLVPITPKTCDNHGQRDKQTRVYKQSEKRADKLENKIGDIF